MDKGESYQIIATDNRHQRAALILRNVEYVIEAHFDLNLDKAGESDTVEKHYNIVMRRLKNGQFFYQPTLGTREFAASFELIEQEADIPKSNISGELDLGYMLYDLNFSVDKKKTKQTVNPSFFRAKLKDGILDLQNVRNEVRI
jgi:CRISPR-associated protein Cas5d